MTSQVVVDDQGTLADEKIAPLVAKVLSHGLTILSSSEGGEDEPGNQFLACLVFAEASEALEFLLQSALLLNYQIGDMVGLFVTRPLTGETPSAKAVWHPNYTHTLVQAWIS